MNMQAEKDEESQTQSIRKYFSRDLAEELDNLEIDGDDEGDDDPEGYDPMNISDFLNSNGDLTGVSEWTDSENEDESKRVRSELHQNLAIGTVVSITDVTHDGPNNSRLHPVENMEISKQGQTSFAGRNSPAKLKTVYTVPNYGCRVYSGFGRDGSSGSEPWRIMPGTETEQIFTRAPNFRTPGGYKPPLVEKEPRNLTDEEIFQEVKQMYAEDQVSSMDSAEKDKDSLEFLILPSEVEKLEAKESEKIEPIKLIPIQESKFTKSKTWECGASNEDNVCRDSCLETPTESAKTAASIGSASSRRIQSSRQENVEELNRLWSEIQETKARLERDMSSLINDHSDTLPPKTSRAQEFDHNSLKIQPTISPKNFTNVVQRSYSFGKRAFDLPSTAAAAIPLAVGDNGAGEMNSNRTQTSKSSSKIAKQKRTTKRIPEKQRGRRVERLRNNYNNASSATAVKTGVSFSSELDTLKQGEVDQILDQSHIEDSDLDEILSEMSDQLPDVGASGIRDFFNHSDTPYELRLALQEQQLAHSTKEFNDTISKLGQLSEGLLLQWKSHMKEYKEPFEQLQSDNAKLKADLRKTKERVKAYEEELERAIEISRMFKDKVNCALEDLEIEKISSREQNTKLEERINSLESTLAETKAEKESGYLALKACQNSLDAAKQSLLSKSDELETLDSQRQRQEVVLNRLVVENEELKVQKRELVVGKSEMDSIVLDLREEIEKLKTGKVILESLRESDRRKLKEEREKLHEYYNTKIKEILQAESQKMITAEKEFIELHEKNLKRVEDEAEERLDKMRNKLSVQVQQMRNKFETELNILKKENEEQGRVIGAVSKQIHSFSQRGSKDDGGVLKRLEKLKNGISDTEKQAPIETNGELNDISRLVEALARRERQESPTSLNSATSDPSE